MFTSDEKLKIQEALVAMWSIFKPTDEMPIIVQRSYAAALADLGVEGIVKACGIAMQKSEWLPKPVQLRELLTGNVDQQAENAWTQVVTAIEQHGGYNSVEFNDGRISVAISNCGGWQNFCEKSETWAKKEFLAAFKNLPADCRPVRLVGIHDKNNNRYRPKQIGYEGQPRIAAPAATELSEMAKQVAIGMEVS